MTPLPGSVGNPQVEGAGEVPRAEGAQEAAEESGAEAAEDAAKPLGPLAGIRRRLGRALWTRRGLALMFVLVAGIGSALTVGTVAAIQWTETADFCGRCHTMGPELKAYEMSAHRGIACAECHVEPGIAGWLKGKVQGTRQLFEIITGSFPKPIPAPDHADLPSVTTSCQRCHDVSSLLANGGQVSLVLRDRYAQDEASTKSSVALVIRPVGFGGTGTTRGVHWHIGEDVTYYTADPRAQTIDAVTVRSSTGEVDTFIAAQKIAVSDNVQPDIDHLAQVDRQHRMDCIDCHNRVGHGIPGLSATIDDALDGGQISQTLPYIKKEALDLLSVQYPSESAADAAIDSLRDFYGTRYPLVASAQQAALSNSIDDLKRIYRLVATPEMQVTAATYPNDLGHLSAPGCFRCHDGAHYRILNGAVTKETIPSTCATCHTFPQIGSQESGVLIGHRPSTHDDRLWVFDHKTVVSSVDPAKAGCGACHTPTYCQNCHATPVAKIPHDDMVLNHARVARDVGEAACATCHQPAYCAQCHAEPVLPTQSPELPGQSPEGGGTGDVAPPGGLRWPLLAVRGP